MVPQSGLAGTSAGMSERLLPVYSSVPFASCYIYSLLKPYYWLQTCTQNLPKAV